DYCVCQFGSEQRHNSRNLAMRPGLSRNVPSLRAARGSTNDASEDTAFRVVGRYPPAYHFEQQRPSDGLQWFAVRIVIARCTVDYVGRLTAHLPLATRLLVIKADGSILIHADAGTKALNWMPAGSCLTYHAVQQ